MEKVIALPTSYQRPKDLIFAAKVFLALLIATIGIGLTLSANLPAMVAGIFLIGAMMAHAIELQHQTLHGTAFHNRSLNRAMGFLLGLPALVSYRHYQIAHLRHHRYCGTSKDSEFFVYSSANGSGDVMTYLRAAFNYRRLKKVVTLIFASFFRSKPYLEFPSSAKLERSIHNEYRIIGCILTMTFAICLYFGWHWQLGVLWIAPLLFVAEPLHFLIELPEHLGCDRQSHSAYENTRTIRSNRFWFWFTNGNNFHVEHHLYPNLPMERLPHVHQFIRRKIVHLNIGYVDFIRQTLGGTK